MKVYIVTADVDLGYHIVQIFKSESKAKAFLRKCIRECPYSWHGYELMTMEVVE